MVEDLDRVHHFALAQPAEMTVRHPLGGESRVEVGLGDVGAAGDLIGQRFGFEAGCDQRLLDLALRQRAEDLPAEQGDIEEEEEREGDDRQNQLAGRGRSPWGRHGLATIPPLARTIRAQNLSLHNADSLTKSEYRLISAC